MPRLPEAVEQKEVVALLASDATAEGELKKHILKRTSRNKGTHAEKRYPVAEA
jgi:hypothetical protein